MDQQAVLDNSKNHADNDKSDNITLLLAPLYERFVRVILSECLYVRVCMCARVRAINEPSTGLLVFSHV